VHSGNVLVQAEQVAGRGVGIGVGVGVGVGAAVGAGVCAGVGVGTDMGVGVCGGGIGNNPGAEDEGDGEPGPGVAMGEVPGWDEPLALPPGVTPTEAGKLPPDDVPVP